MIHFPHPSCSCPTGRRSKYPGLGKIDCRILCAALEQGLIKPDQLWTSVPCGSSPGWAGRDGFIDSMHQIDAHHRLRADVIWKLGEVLHLAEIKPDAGYCALGQVLTYSALWNREHPAHQLGGLHIITTTPHIDLPYVANRYAIDIIATAQI